jgi:hypothetical protein
MLLEQRQMLSDDGASVVVKTKTTRITVERLMVNGDDVTTSVS